MAELQGRAVGRSTAQAGVEVLTISSNVAQGSDQDCKRVLVWVPDGNTGAVSMNIDATADANDVVLSSDTVYELFVTNTDKLHFYSSNDTDKVYLYWEN